MQTIWVLPDRLTRRGPALRDARPAENVIFIVDALPAVERPRWHRQRVWLQRSAVEHFATSLRSAGFAVDLHRPPDPTSPSAAFPTFGEAAFRLHCDAYRPDRVTAEEPASWAERRLLTRLGVRLLPTGRFLVDYDDFRDWAQAGHRLLMDSFYRRQRRRLGYLMDHDRPVGGLWSCDRYNRRRAGRDHMAPPTPRWSLDAVDRSNATAVASFRHAFGAPPDGAWPTTRRRALAALRHFVVHRLASFGRLQDAMLHDDWHLAHSLLSPVLNLGLLDPREACDAAEAALRAGAVPLAAAEGFIRQIIGWRAYVWGIYRWRMPDYARLNALDAQVPLPPALLGEAPTSMACLATALDGVERRAYLHHIQRLMVIGNLALLTGIDPGALTEWMLQSFVDGHHWVMVPNVLGMALWADGGLMATKPYAAGGRYIDRMSDYCRGCGFDPGERVRENACPYTTLYWDFLLRHRARLAGVGRIGTQLAAAPRLRDVDLLRSRAADVRARLGDGVL